jgi:hypothetical protein
MSLNFVRACAFVAAVNYLAAETPLARVVCGFTFLCASFALVIREWSE